MIGLGIAAVSASLLGLFGEAALPDSVLAEQRGGFRLPSGIDVALTVQTDTAVNGAILLRSIYRVDEGVPKLQVYAPPEGRTVNESVTGRTEESGTVPPIISFDRMTGLQVKSLNDPAAPKVSIATGGSASTMEGLEQVDLAQPIRSGGGWIAAGGSERLQTVELKGSDISITHVIGDAFGSAILNTADERMIDTQTTASIDLRNAGPDVLGSAMMRIENATLDALAARL